jgi:hypothetical protein
MPTWFDLYSDRDTTSAKWKSVCFQIHYMDSSESHTEIVGVFEFHILPRSLRTMIHSSLSEERSILHFQSFGISTARKKQELVDSARFAQPSRT